MAFWAAFPLRTALFSTDSHAPAEARTIAPSRNMVEFFAALDIEPGDSMWLAPEERIVNW